jgi:hypothetical protein
VPGRGRRLHANLSRNNRLDLERMSREIRAEIFGDPARLRTGAKARARAARLRALLDRVKPDAVPSAGGPHQRLLRDQRSQPGDLDRRTVMSVARLGCHRRRGRCRGAADTPTGSATSAARARRPVSSSSSTMERVGAGAGAKAPSTVIRVGKRDAGPRSPQLGRDAGAGTNGMRILGKIPCH